MSYAAESQIPEAPNRPVQSLASRALSVLAGRRACTVAPLVHLLDMLEAGALSREPGAPGRALDRLRRAHVPLQDVAERYVPEVARRMGAKWCDDRMSFAEVSIGAARLQSLLRDIDRTLTETEGHRDRPVAGVLVVADAHHTLGAMVLTGQLRRRGVSVRLSLGQAPAEVAALARTIRFDAVMVSASHTESLVFLNDMIDKIRKAMPSPVPVVVGGCAVSDSSGAKTTTGADHICNDPDQALRLCGLTGPTTDLSSAERH
ncbi:cobalamin B12-binding domain-containing protein [Tranquillimonas alkanivorans]|uniref:Methanogenic corrinoid protein MtbC1 n=1 Tax=Tranquillimonas alkanivorans TaxID=441119 RepID=A0A1I5LE95_9RHOB|nr:cobalamin B12-binding domain-containing protein [Tranquillimonas alkanivorans]SFO95166.1 Methanogenic corrinoid protein MtbC1 [Tranquillimonas alkanivorans]